TYPCVRRVKPVQRSSIDRGAGAASAARRASSAPSNLSVRRGTALSRSTGPVGPGSLASAPHAATSGSSMGATAARPPQVWE
ncbi:MAG: hypothetical protein RAK18_05600, partial [Conexivisphaerales archaeon]|nr:hypothetical protein [Conexivisphaerales archaeon]